MAIRHLFPCPSCNHTLEIEPAQAGRSIACPKCAAEVDLPTMRKIRDLPISQESRGSDRTGWDPQRQRLLSIGLGIVFVGLLIAGVFQFLRNGLNTKIPDLANLEGVYKEVDSQPIDELFDIWKERVRPSELAEPEPNPIVLDIRTDRRYFGLVIGGLVVMLAGGGMITWVIVGYPKPTTP